MTKIGAWGMRFLNVLLAGAVVSLNVVSPEPKEVWAQSKGQTIKQEVQTLRNSRRRWIQVRLSQQKLIAWEGKTPVYSVIVSTGKKSTPTLTGVFRVQTKYRKTRMQGQDYDIPNVPHTMYYSGSYAIHGAYWHNRFGTPISHGCVNVAPKHAKWLYNWASIGTPVVVQR
ncbi:MAG: L,D-transpeptidase [Scytonema sp. PMC 1069.18]|nr:L,D-transpeptidase [Scytonema sp. PMC 1069.18]MEC4881625.1 L,D-transpeptidase [Scytonema sp. PMC 1070.18]